jgi:DnaJ like chaperone protein
MGKLVGGTIGFAIGGPLGAAAGVVFGHVFDSGREEGQGLGDTYLSTLETPQLTFFVSLFSMLAKITKADGPINMAEIDAVESFAVKDLRLASPDQEVALKIFRTALESPAVFEDFARQFPQQFLEQPRMTEMVINVLLKVSVADGPLKPAEERLIEVAVRFFSMDSQRYQQIRARYIKASDHAYQVLGCVSSDPDEKIKKQYRQLVQSYHPDKISGSGAPEDLVQQAYAKFRVIQDAYQTIKKERGIK